MIFLYKIRGFWGKNEILGQIFLSLYYKFTSLGLLNISLQVCLTGLLLFSTNKWKIFELRITDDAGFFKIEILKEGKKVISNNPKQPQTVSTS